MIFILGIYIESNNKLNQFSHLVIKFTKGIILSYFKIQFT